MEFESPCPCKKMRSCKVCQTAYNSAWYQKNKLSQYTRVKENNKRYFEENRDFIRRAKSEPCTDCKNRFHWFAMDYDHARGEKIRDLSLMIRNFPLQRIIEEIAKCDLVCATCHRLRTAARLGLSP